MPTLDTLADSALSEVYGHTQTQEVGTYLAVPMSATDLTFTVSNAAGFSRGLVQIGDELAIVDAVDRDKNLLTIGYITGRGVRSTQVATHVVGDRVTMSPLIPRQKAKDAVTEAIRASNLYAVKLMDFSYQATIHAYSLPPGFRDVLNVQWLPPGPDVVWHPIRRWTADRFSRSIVLGESPVQGHPVKVTYSADPAVPSSFSEDFSSTGLPDSCYDVIRWSTAWRLVSFMEPFNLAGIRAEGDAMRKPESSGSRLRVSQYFYQMFAQREQEELMDLQQKFPVRTHFSGTI